jgi:RimK family alpha-L-glutamate ligase
MSKIIFINGGSKDFGQKFRKKCEEIGVDCLSVRALYTSFFVKEEGIEIWHRGERVDIGDLKYAFIRVRGRVPHTASLLLQILSHFGINHNDFSNTEHTESVEKITQMVRLSLGGVQVPKTYIFNRFTFKFNKILINSKINYPCVLKTGGSKGEMVWKVNSLKEIKEKAKEIEKEMIMVQEFIPNDFDIRVLCMFGEVVGAIKRSSTDNFYNNLAKGGKSETIEITEEEREIAKKACDVLKVDFGGVDIVRTESGPMIFEVNTGPQVYGFEEATGINVPGELVERIKKHFL